MKPEQLLRSILIHLLLQKYLIDNVGMSDFKNILDKEKI